MPSPKEIQIGKDILLAEINEMPRGEINRCAGYIIEKILIAVEAERLEAMGYSKSANAANG